MIIKGEEIFVVHFSTTTAEHEYSFPNDLKNVLEKPSDFCLSCSAFTRSMLASRDFKPIGHVGLMLEVFLYPETQNTCCDIGHGNIRAAYNSDLGKMFEQAPCLPQVASMPENAPPTQAAILASLNCIKGHNEWIIKPPHKVIGLFIDNNCPRVMTSDSHDYWIPTTVKNIRHEFPDTPIWMRNYDNGLGPL